MFDFVDKHKKIVHIIFGLVSLTFVFWGVQSYRSMGGNDVANVNGLKIAAGEFDAALHQQQERMRQSLGAGADASIFDSPGFKLAVLERMIQQKLFLDAANEAGIAVTDEELVEMIRKIPAFQKDGAFSNDRYVELLRGQGLTPVRFEQEVKEDLARQQLVDFVTRDSFLSGQSAKLFLAMLGEQRVVSEADFDPSAYVSKQTASEAEVAKYYKDHEADFRVPEMVKVQYLALSPEALEAQVSVSDDDVKKYYAAHPAEFSVPEEREASHILIAVAKDAPQAEIDAAKAKALQIEQDLKKDPSRFAELAKQYSQDPGSAANGGSLGFFKRGMMVKPFDDAVFSMKAGEISAPVRTDFGFHIIRLDAVKPEKVKTIDEVHDEIVHEIRKQEAGKRFSESADGFSNKVYEQSGSLQPAADAYKLQVKESGWIDASGNGDAEFPANPKLLKAIFSPDSLKKKQNTEAVEVSTNVLVSAHVTQEKPAYTKPQSEVEEEIRKRILAKKAEDAAVAEGKDALAKLQSGKEAAVNWKDQVALSRRSAPPGMDPSVAQAVLRADVKTLPAYVGVESPQGYRVVKIVKLVAAPQPSVEEVQGFGKKIAGAESEQELGSYFTSLKSRAKITVNRKLVAPQAQ